MRKINFNKLKLTREERAIEAAIERDEYVDAPEKEQEEVT